MTAVIHDRYLEIENLMGQAHACLSEYLRSSRTEKKKIAVDLVEQLQEIYQLIDILCSSVYYIVTNQKCGRCYHKLLTLIFSLEIDIASLFAMKEIKEIIGIIHRKKTELRITQKNLKMMSRLSEKTIGRIKKTEATKEIKDAIQEGIGFFELNSEILDRFNNVYQNYVFIYKSYLIDKYIAEKPQPYIIDSIQNLPNTNDLDYWENEGI